MKKTYTITIETINEKMNMHRVNNGFNAFELLGLLEICRSEILQQLKGEIKPDFIKRDVIEDLPEALNVNDLLCKYEYSARLSSLCFYFGLNYYNATIRDISNISESHIKQMKGIGDKTVKKIKYILSKYNLTLKP